MPLDGSAADGGASLAGIEASSGREPARPAAGKQVPAEGTVSAEGTRPAEGTGPAEDRVAANGTAPADETASATGPAGDFTHSGDWDAGRPVAAGAVTPDLTAKPGEAGAPSPRRRRGDLVPWLIASGVFAAYTVISLFRYLRRDPTSWDLGIFTEYIKQIAHLHAPIVDIRGPGINLFGDHFHPIVAVLAPLFLAFPTSVTLLAAQAALVAVSVIPVYRAAAHLLGRGTAAAIATAYGFSWGLQQLANYDFHEIAFAVPLLAFSLSALVRGRMRAAICWALPLVLVKEDQGFTLAAIGLIIAISYRRQTAGLLLAAWGVAWSLLAILVIIPHFNAGHSYPYWSQGGAISPVGGSFSIGGLWAHLSMGAATKLPALALILLPVVFIALRSPLVLAIVPSLALRFIALKPAYWGWDWHYNATVMPIVFIAAIDGIARLRASHRRRVAADGTGGSADRRLGSILEHYGAAIMIGVAAALAFQFPLSSLWNPATYALGPHVAAENAAMAMVPDGAKVSTDLDLLAPLAARTDTYWLGNFNNPVTTYVVFDTQSTDWQPPPPNIKGFVEGLEHGKSFRQVFERDGVYVFRLAG